MTEFVLKSEISVVLDLWDCRWTPDGPRMDPGWTPDGPQMDLGWTGMDLG